MVRHLWVVLGFCATLSVVSCHQSPSQSESAEVPTWRGVCIDQDGDGYGFQCAPGLDCDDANPQIHVGCPQCAKANEGCACVAGAAPVDCTLSPELTPAGGLLCKEGTHYCRDGHWSACEGISSFAAPPPNKVRGLFEGLIDQDSGVQCSVCSPDCTRVTDPLVSVDAGAASGITGLVGGGITLAGGGASGPAGDGGLLDNYGCVPGSAPDVNCDGIPDSYAPTPMGTPFQTSHKTIFMTLAPGQSGFQNLAINFNLASADIYFYIDMTGSMGGERDNLIASLSSGNYLPASVAAQNCADRDGDGSPDNYLKTLGVAGNIACLIRDAQFGTGWFRDLPFAAHGAIDYEMFEHRLDITSDVSAVQTSLQGFQTRGGVDLPEGSSQGLWAIPTAGEVYVGWDRPGIPSRTTCPAGTWGYPCFRNGAVPIVIHVTDDGMNNGPPTTSGGATYPFSYLSANLGGMNIGTPNASGLYYRPLTTTAETFATSQDFGTVDGSFITYAGSTEKMSSDLTYLTTGNCPSGSAWDPTSQGGHDAVFKFTVGSKLAGVNRNIKLSSSGSRFNSSLLLLGTPPTYTGISASNNGSFATAQSLGTISPGRLVISGDNSSLPSVYARESLTTSSSCFVGTTANDLEPASVLQFRLLADQTLRFTSTAGSPVNTALFMGSALEPTTTDLSTLDCGSGVSSNCNDKIGQFSLGELASSHEHLINGNTSDAHVHSDYASQFSSCGGATYAAAGDTVVDFTLAAATTVRIETSGSGSNMQAGFPHGIAVVKKPTTVATSKAVPAGNTDQSTAYAILEADIPAPGTFVSYTGNSSTDAPTYAQSEVGGASPGTCHNGNAGGATTAKDVVFKFAVTATQAYEFDTAPSPTTSGYQTWLSLHNGNIARSTTMAVSNAAELDTPAGQPVATLAQGAIDSRQLVLTGGQIDQRNVSYSPNIMGSYCGSTTNSPSSMGGRDAVFQFHATTSGSVTITTVGAAGTSGTTPNFNSFFAVYRSSITGANMVSPNCPSPGLFGFFGSNPDQAGNGWTQTISTTAGTDYFVVVKEWAYDPALTATTGQFGLLIQDSRFVGSFVSCDAGSSPTSNNFSRLSATLTPGTYYLVLKGTGVGPNQNYSLNVRKPGSSVAGTTVSCMNSASNRAVIPSLALAAGEYSVIVKGQQTSSCFLFICSNSENNGAYNLTIRDLAVAPAPLACTNTATAAAMTPPLLKKNDALGNPIDYYLVTRGNTAGSAYQVVIEDSSVAAASGATACDDDSGQVLNGEMTQSLAPGTYYAVLKGRTSNDYGMFQMSIGEDKAGVTSTGTFTPKAWPGASGYRAALINNNVHVIAVDAVGTADMFRGSPSYLQTLVLAGDTGAPTVSPTQTYEIATNGTGMGSAVITAVNDLANALSMNLGLVLTPIAPNIPAKPFGFVVQALPGSGNCSAPIDTDGDGIADTFVACRPGATPTFKVTITNPPAPNNVPSSALDRNGGYQMKVQVIGNGRFVMDEVPVYVIPQNLTPPASLYPSSGSYEQTINSSCSGTGAPSWRSLSWDATLPAGTSMVWSVCSGDTAAALSTCTLSRAATVTSGSGCTSSSQCPNGYCASSGVCEYVVGPACGSAADCGNAGACVGGTCAWTQNPIDLLPALVAGQEGPAMMRVNLVLNANAAKTAAPTVQDWHLEYVCSPQI
ncbi:MAG: internalin [Myxococcaceae bacterium]|nr:internalin [Myxococcaceae bacterium]